MIGEDETAAQAWARCGPYLDAALARSGGTHALSDVAALIERGQAQFWPGRRAAVVTEVCEHPRLKACNIWLLGGALDELLAMEPAIAAWARAQGCRRLLGGAPRRGWTRALRRAGFAPRWIIYSKELTP